MPSTRAAARAAQQTITATARSRVFDDPNLFDLILSNLNAKSLAHVEQVCTAWRAHDKEAAWSAALLYRYPVAGKLENYRSHVKTSLTDGRPIIEVKENGEPHYTTSKMLYRALKKWMPCGFLSFEIELYAPAVDGAEKVVLLSRTLHGLDSRPGFDDGYGISFPCLPDEDGLEALGITPHNGAYDARRGFVNLHRAGRSIECKFKIVGTQRGVSGHIPETSIDQAAMRCKNLGSLFAVGEYVDDVNPLLFKKTHRFWRPPWAPSNVDTDSDDEDEAEEEHVEMEVEVHIHNNGPPGGTHGDVDGVSFRVEFNLTPEHSGEPYKHLSYKSGEPCIWDALCMELGINPIFDAGCPPTVPSRRL